MGHSLQRVLPNVPAAGRAAARAVPAAAHAALPGAPAVGRCGAAARGWRGAQAGSAVPGQHMLAACGCCWATLRSPCELADAGRPFARPPPGPAAQRCGRWAPRIIFTSPSSATRRCPSWNEQRCGGQASQHPAAVVLGEDRHGVLRRTLLLSGAPPAPAAGLPLSDWRHGGHPAAVNTAGPQPHQLDAEMVFPRAVSRGAHRSVCTRFVTSEAATRPGAGPPRVALAVLCGSSERAPRSRDGGGREDASTAAGSMGLVLRAQPPPAWRRWKLPASAATARQHCAHLPKDSYPPAAAQLRAALWRSPCAPIAPARPATPTCSPIACLTAAASHSSNTVEPSSRRNTTPRDFAPREARRRHGEHQHR